MSVTAYTWQVKNLYTSAFECIEKYDGKHSQFYKKVRASCNLRRLFIAVGLLLWFLSGVVFIAINDKAVFGNTDVGFWDYIPPLLWIGMMFTICIYPYVTKRHFKEINLFMGWYKVFYNKGNSVTKKDYENFKRSIDSKKEDE